MGRQSSRIYYQVKDHKEIYYGGHYHKAMYIGSQLVWEKLKLGVTWEVAVGDITPGAYVVRSNGSVLCLIDNFTHNIYVSSDGKEWTTISNPFGDYYLLSESLNSDKGSFIATKTYKLDGTIYYQPAISVDGNSWESVNKITLYYDDNNYKEYTSDGSTDYKLVSEQNDRKNGRYVVLNGQGSGQYINAVSEVNIKTSDGTYTGSRIIALQYINGYYYFLSRTNVSGVGLWRTSDFKSFEMIFIVDNSVGVFDYTSIIMEYAGDIYVIYASTGSPLDIVSYKSSDGVTFEEYDFLYSIGKNGNWLDYIAGNEEMLVHAYTDRIFVNDAEYLISDMYEESLGLYRPHVNIIGNKIYVTYTNNYGESPIVTFIGTVEG